MYCPDFIIQMLWIHDKDLSDTAIKIYHHTEKNIAVIFQKVSVLTDR